MKDLTCPDCGADTVTGRWLRWCSNAKKCRWRQVIPKQEDEAA